MNYFAGLDVGERRRHADASYVEGENGLISALSGADEFCFIAGGMGEAMKVVWLAVFVTITSSAARVWGLPKIRSVRSGILSASIYVDNVCYLPLNQIGRQRR